MNQRATHFQLGKTSQNYQSIYEKDYPKKEAGQKGPAGNNPFRGSSTGPQQKGNFATTNKTLLRAWDNAEIARLDDDKLKELKSHHFKLGSYQPQESMTTNKIYHDRKGITGEASKCQEESKNKMRGHNHQFKEQHYTNYKSAYSGQFTPKDRIDNQTINRNQGQNAICFGNQALPMLTTNTTSYTPKEAQISKAKPGPSLGVNLGDKSEPMGTINQLYFNQKQIVKASLPQSTMKELRGTHFNMGQASLNYQTENNYYRAAPGSSVDSKLHSKMPTYESGTWNAKNAKFNGNTTNKSELPIRDVKPFERAEQYTRNGMDLGGHPGTYTTEFKKKFSMPQNPIANNLQISKKSNVVIGSGANHYLTEQKASYKTNNLKEGRIDVDIKKLNTEDHFKIGGSHMEPKITIYQDQHRSDVQNRNKLFHKERK